eukprot:515228-Prymnesium_polylepis.2
MAAKPRPSARLYSAAEGSAALRACAKARYTKSACVNVYRRTAAAEGSRCSASASSCDEYSQTSVGKRYARVHAISSGNDTGSWPPCSARGGVPGTDASLIHGGFTRRGNVVFIASRVFRSREVSIHERSDSPNQGSE